MLVAGEKTQLLVLSQCAADAADGRLHYQSRREAGARRRSAEAPGCHPRQAAAFRRPLPHPQSLCPFAHSSAAQTDRAQLGTRGAATPSSRIWLPARCPGAHGCCLVPASRRHLPHTSRRRDPAGRAAVLGPAAAVGGYTAALAARHFPAGLGPRRRDSTPDETLRAAGQHLASIPQRTTWVWTDGSATGGVEDRGAGAHIEGPDGTIAELREPAGRFCSSYRAEMLALRTAIQHVTSSAPTASQHWPRFGRAPWFRGSHSAPPCGPGWNWPH